MKKIILSMLSMILAVPSMAWAWTQGADCTSKIFADYDIDYIQVAAVDGDEGDQHHFFANKGNDGMVCSDAGEASCNTKAYLLTYDHVVVAFGDSGYRCTAYVSKAGKMSVGFLPDDTLTFIGNLYDHEAPALADWVGVFGNGDQSLAIQQENEGFTAKAKIKNQDFVLGGLAENNTGELYSKQDNKCTVEMRLFNDEYLFIGNPRGQCGIDALGGIYRRQ